MRDTGRLLVLGAMLGTLPLVVFKGPGGMTPMDGVNALFVAAYWAVIVVRRDQVAMPLLGSFLLILLGSATALYAVVDRGVAALTVFQEVYLYVWFVTLAHFLARSCRLDAVVVLWVAIAATVAVLTVADARAGLLGGRFAGGSRALGTFENPNMYGNYLVLSFFLAWSVASAGRRWLYLALPVLFVGIRATASNGALLAFLGGCAIVVVAAPANRTAPRLGSALMGAAALLTIVGLGHEPLRRAAAGVLSQERGAVGGAALKGYGGRYPLWLDALEQIERAPGGVGPGNFNIAGGRNSATHLSAHNEYLGMLTERGPLGLAGWCGILLGVLGMVRRLGWASAGGARTLAPLPLYGLLGAVAVHATVIELSHFRHFWLAIALLAAAVAQARAPTAVALRTDPALEAAA
jgi:hypothetical protein